MGDDRPSVYEEGDKLIVRASASGYCIKALVAHGIGLTPEAHPEWLLAKFEEGNVGEELILRMVAEKYDMEISHQQQEYEIEVGNRVKIRMHIDGIGSQVIGGEGHQVVVEAKAISTDTYKILENKGIEEMYYMACQLSLEMAGTGLPGLLACGIKDEDGKVVRLETYSFDTPPISLGSIKAKMLKVARLVDEGVLPPCDYAQYPCQFYYLHDGEEVHKGKEVSGVDKDDEKEWDQAAAQYDASHRAEKQIKERKKEAGERLAKLFDAAGKKGGKVETVGYVVNDVVQVRKGNVQEGKLREAGIDPELYRGEEYEIRYWNIKTKKIKGDGE